MGVCGSCAGVLTGGDAGAAGGVTGTPPPGSRGGGSFGSAGTGSSRHFPSATMTEIPVRASRPARTDAMRVRVDMPGLYHPPGGAYSAPVIGELLHRLLWFAVAVAIGLLWAYSEQLSGRALPVHAHAVLGTLFLAALGTGGYNVRMLLSWYRELQQLGTVTGLSAQQVRDVRALARLIESQDGPAIRSLRAALHDSGVVRLDNPPRPSIEVGRDQGDPRDRR